MIAQTRQFQACLKRAVMVFDFGQLLSGMDKAQVEGTVNPWLKRLNSGSWVEARLALIVLK